MKRSHPETSVVSGPSSPVTRDPSPVTRHPSPVTRHPSPRGAAAVEFAVVAPLMFLVVLGLVEFGRAIMVQQSIVSAARESCRVAVLAGTTRQDVVDRATASLSTAGISNFTITMNPDPPSGAAEGTPVTVTIRVPFNNVTWLAVPIYLGGKNLTASCVMRREWN